MSPSELLPHLAMARDSHERTAEHRDDRAWLDRQWADPGSRVLVVAGARVRPVDGAIAWVSPADAPDGLRVLLGQRGETTYFAVMLEPETAPGDPDDWVVLRQVVQRFADADVSDAPLVFHAVGLAEWLGSHRFCPRCGTALEPRSSGHVLACPGCGRNQFPRSDPAVIMMVLDGEPGSPDERALLGRHPHWPEGRYSTLAGFVEPGEGMEDAVRREVAEEVGVRIGEVSYFGSQPWPLPASLMIGFFARAETTTIEVDGVEISDARWLTREEMRDEAEAGSLVLPGGFSISRSLIEHWYGGSLPGHW